MADLRQHALAIFEAALRAADPAEAVRRNVSLEGDTLRAGDGLYDLAAFERIFVIGAGKAGAAMAQGLESILGGRITAGLINVKYGHVAPLKRVELNECGHPVPDEAGVRGVRRIEEIAGGAGERDLVICLISGGASALTPAPADGITLAEKQLTTKLLLSAGADIFELNTVRKHISTLKGGQLARLAAPATVITLILSDVIGDDLSVIGSGPTAPDPSTYADAVAILPRFDLLDGVPVSVRARLERGEPETPKAGDAVFARVRNVIVGSNKLAVESAEQAARGLGYETAILSTTISGEARNLAVDYAGRLKAMPPGSCAIAGGETTVTVRGSGLGGRNQEFAMVAGMALDGVADALVLSGGTDGTDGPTDAAGGIGDGATMERARAAGIDAAEYLARNDSYHFLARLGDLVMTGPTNTNVMDVVVMLRGVKQFSYVLAVAAG